MMIVLGVVVAMVVGLGRLAQRYQGGRGAKRQVGRIDVLARRSVGKNAALLVVRVAHRTFLVSQSAAQLHLVSELDDDEWRTESASDLTSSASSSGSTGPGTARSSGEMSASAWDAFIERVREMTVRR